MPARWVVIACMLFWASPVRAQLAVAWNEDETTVGMAGVVGTRAPWRSRRGTLPIGPNAVLAPAPRGQILSLSRDAGTVTLFSPHGRVRRRVDLGAASQLEDIAAAGRCGAYVTRRNSGRLLHIDLCSGAMRESVDLADYADSDGNPDLGAMLVDDGRLFVQVRRYNEKATMRFEPPAYLAVVDLAGERLIDTDPAAPGTQAIELAGTSPKHRMQVVHATRRLYVSASGGSFDAGGIEAVDLTTLRSAGLVIREVDGTVGADVGPFVMTTAQSGYLVFTTDLTLSSHLHAFTTAGSINPDGLNVTVNYAVPALAYDPLAGTLFLPDSDEADGLLVFDAASGARLRSEPIPTGGPPTDVLLLRRFRDPRP